MTTTRIEAGWMARHEVEKFPTTQAAIADYTKASERWIDHILKVSDFVRDCPRL